MSTMRKFLFIVLVLGTIQLRSQQGLQAEYYNGTNFQTKITSRVDRAIDFDWPLNVSPAAGVDPSFFSARWTGKLLPPKSGKYTFSAKVDDGIRVWVGGKKVIDAWDLHDSENFTGSIELVANQQYDLKVEYFNDIFEGEIHLLWVMPGEGNAIIDLFRSSAKPVEAKYFIQPARAQPVDPKPVAKPPAKAQPKPKKNTVKPEPAKQKPETSTRPEVQKPALKPAATPPALPPAEVAKKQRDLELKSIYFVQSKDLIVAASQKTLDDWVTFLQQQKPDAVIVVKGHTDELGDATKNQELSEKRALLVANYLVEHGLDKSRIETKGYGSSQPVFVNPATEKDRAMNRRVEIRVKK